MEPTNAPASPNHTTAGWTENITEYPFTSPDNEMLHLLLVCESYFELGQVFNGDGTNMKDCHLHRQISKCIRERKP